MESQSARSYQSHCLLLVVRAPAWPKRDFQLKLDFKTMRLINRTSGAVTVLSAEVTPFHSLLNRQSCAFSAPI